MVKQPQDRLASRKKPVTLEVPIVLDSLLADKFVEAQERYEEAKNISDRLAEDESSQRETAAAKKELDELREEMRKNTQIFVFRSIGRKPYDDLLALYPVTQAVKDRVIAEAAEKDKEEAKNDADNLNWDPFTFPQAVVQACCISPVLSEADIQEMWEGPDWNDAEISTLTSAAILVNQSRRVVELGKG